MTKMSLPLIFLVVTVTTIFLPASNSGFATSNQEKVATILYSGNLNGELEPCGCTEEGDLGGLRRRATTINNVRKENPDLLLISTGGLLSSESTRDRLKSDYILKGIATMKYDAIGVQWRDFAYGEDFILNRELNWVISNWGRNNIPISYQIERSNKKYSIFNWLNHHESPQKQMQGEQISFKNRPQFLYDAISAAKKSGAITLLMTTLSLTEASQLIILKDVDILFVQSAHEVYGDPELVGSTLVLQPGSRGMRMGRIDIKINSKNRIESYKHHVIPLTKDVVDAEYLADWYDSYNKSVKENYLKRVELKKMNQSGKSPYIGEEACKTCHPKQYERWSQSKHAQAFSAIEDVNKVFDPDCIVCHTVGFEKKGGYIDPTITPHLLNVQCESCHGAGAQHAQSGGSKPVEHFGWKKEKICQQCHVGGHSPLFKLENYWPRIAH